MPGVVQKLQGGQYGWSGMTKWGTAGEGEEAAVRKHGSAWIMQATAAPGGPGTQGSHGHAGGW